MTASIDNTLFILAGSFARDGFVSEGYKVYSPYVEHNVFERVLREICFKSPLLPKRVWYNKSICKQSPDYIIVSDPLITSDFLRWIQELFPHAQLNYTYGNLVGHAKHLQPSMIPRGWRVWTFDGRDSAKYGLRLYQSFYLYKKFVKPKEELKYDVLYVGRDKGRGEYLIQLEEKMKSIGLRTNFVVTSDGRLSKKKSYYQKEISYYEIINLIVKSKSILNVALPGQEGMTIRDMESMFFGVKLITTNKHTINMDFYCPENVFILNELEINDIPGFLETSYVEVSPKILQKHSIASYVNEITQS